MKKFDFSKLKQKANEILKKIDLSKFKQKANDIIKKLMKDKISFACTILAVIAFVVVICLVVDYAVSTGESEAKMDALRTEAQQSSANQEASQSGGNEGGNTTGDTPSGVPVVEADQNKNINPYKELFGQNEDLAGWLFVEDTKIDYPVMQTMENETYYIDKDFYGNKDKAGCLLLDTDSSLTQTGTTNLIIHGHNMKAGTMFGELDSYVDQEYCKEHNTIVLYAEDTKREYEVISVFYSKVYYVTDQVFKFYNFFHADTQVEFDDFYNNIKEMSLYDTGVTAELGDNFITLSTCSYHVEDGRFVVVAKEVDRTAYEEDVK